MCTEAALGRAGRVGACGRREPRRRARAGVANLDAPAVVVNHVMTFGAKQHAVAEVSPSAVRCPPSDVVHRGEPRRSSAPGTPAVAFRDRKLLRRCEVPLPAPQIEDLALRAEHRRHRLRVDRCSAGRFDRYRSVEKAPFTATSSADDSSPTARSPPADARCSSASASGIRFPCMLQVQEGGPTFSGTTAPCQRPRPGALPARTARVSQRGANTTSRTRTSPPSASIPIIRPVKPPASSVETYRPSIAAIAVNSPACS